MSAKEEVGFWRGACFSHWTSLCCGGRLGRACDAQDIEMKNCERSNLRVELGWPVWRQGLLQLSMFQNKPARRQAGLSIEKQYSPIRSLGRRVSLLGGGLAVRGRRFLTECAKVICSPSSRVDELVGERADGSISVWRRAVQMRTPCSRVAPRWPMVLWGTSNCFP
jgi:hypothetical protein